MLTISFPRSNLFAFACNGSSPRHKLHSISLTPTTKTNTKSFGRMRKKDNSVLPRTSLITHLKPDRPQPSDEDLSHKKKLVFGNYVAREAAIEEEMWAAACLKAETYWENRPVGEIFLKNLKRNFIDRVCKSDPNVQRTAIESVVGTLDISIRQLSDGETFPERHKEHSFPTINTKKLQNYAYVSNLCVRKSARRQGIGSVMIRFVIEFAKLNGIKSVYVHVSRDNKPAFDLYRKLDFEVVEWQPLR